MTSFDDQYYMRQALVLAEKAAAEGEVPVGAVVVMEGEVIGRGWNQPIGSNDPTAHAEIIALRDAAAKLNNYRIADATLYVTLEPCTMCAGALVHARIKRLVYGAVEPKSAVIESNGCLLEAAYFNHRIECSGGVLADQCSAIISGFFVQRRKLKKQQRGAEQKER